MKREAVSALAVAAIFGWALASPATAADGATARPNVVLILADDMGFSDIGPYGSEIATPNLDRLANGGMKFKQFYNTSRCCPTRACLLTGLYQHQAGMGHMVGAKQNEVLGAPGYTNHLNDSCVTMAEALLPAGYRTYLSGKWHLGGNRPNWPCDRGFEQSFSMITGPFNYFGHTFHQPEVKGCALVQNDEAFVPPKEGWYSTDAFGEHAVKYIRESAAEKKPFFLYLPFNAPHWPLQAKAEDIAKYEGKYAAGWEKLREERHKRQVAMGLIDGKWRISPRETGVPRWESLSEEEKKAWSQRMAVYAAQVDCMDQNIGRVMEALKQAGVENNTLVMFMSDNGGCAEKREQGVKGAAVGSRESFLAYDIGWAHASNTPFRLYKHYVHEGGIASPFIAYWPGMIKAGTVSNQMAHVVDLMPTVLELSSAAYPREHKGKAILPLEGKSLLPILKGKDAAVRGQGEMLYWEHEGNKAVRSGDMKLVAQFPGEWELFDLAADRTEMHDLAKERPEDVKRLSAAWQAWADRAGVKPWKK